MLYECSIDEYNIRKFSPDYSVRMLQNALELSNNLMDKEEIKDKIALFQKKAGKKKHSQYEPPHDDTIKGCFISLAGLFFVIIIMIMAGEGCH